jgi:hypothetical protein
LGDIRQTNRWTSRVTQCSTSHPWDKPA